MSTLYDELVAHRQNKKDKRVFGLVLQGGGMRAVYSAGAFVPLLEYGFGDTFDHVIGSSAGAINGAYFLGADKGTFHTYTDDLTNKNFVNLLRTDKRVDIDYLVSPVLEHKRPVNMDNLKRSRSQLHVIVTNAKTGRKHVISDHQDFANIYEEFRATAALPLLYNKPVQIGRNSYIDGGVSDLLPIDVAHKIGCTDIVVVMTQRLENYRFDRRHDRLVKRLIRHLATSQPVAIREILPTNEKVLQINLRHLTKPFKNTRIYLLEPSDEQVLVSLATTDKPKIEALAALGVADMDKFLHQPLAT